MLPTRIPPGSQSSNDLAHLLRFSHAVPNNPRPGGYSGGNAEDPTYRETIVRWFQYGMTCPLFRQHGDRDHTAIWYYGPEDEKMLGDIIKLRASMKPYFSAQFDLLNATGRPFFQAAFVNTSVRLIAPY